MICTALILALLLSGCQEYPRGKYEARLREPAVSPSERYLLTVDARDREDHEEGFTISRISRNGKPFPIFRSKESFRTRDMLWFLWDERDRVWVYSGDLGTFWVRKRDDLWEKQSHANSDVPAPDLLKQRRPSTHDR